MRRILVLLNARAGTVVDCGPETVTAALAALGEGGRQIDVHMVAPKAMPAAIAEGARASHDALVVGGGDGSVNLAARALAGTSKVLGVLPFGTMNLFARDLRMPAGIDAAVAALKTAAPAEVDLATLDGRAFHSLSGIGFFSQMARAREETRGHPFGRLLGVAWAAVKALRRTGRFRFAVALDGRREVVDAYAVLVTNNRFGPDWRRQRLDEGLLEVHIAEDASTLGLARAGADLLTGGWRDNPGIRSITAREVTIAHVRRRAWTATDGELVRAPMPLHYGVAPRALTVLMAPPEDPPTPAVRATAGADVPA
ncbi:diacylglycerol kinase family protein [Rhodoplanes sp. TEM]|uniref:Diacylglycerol kinase family protein n=1 Tax=Rhodoplanes tepidamans TaxID=200616 RepID=A0ABT5JFL2_RHOTP|nr:MULTISPECIES: diacylglycerol kinase family protein [Rhodoplanes]MDC7788208.1 diacylglycerol kinase family protein [Rhodoplanes tepidamans]MDC7983550.1 diacylglycerol kinase family protein [Rhodoplanes sp. TEM]MDQ0354207.1 diacylglycerol kinase family enzyme [Rhodoplanes tepidamans]